MFALLVVLLNMLITLMADIYKRVKGVQHFVFLKGVTGSEAGGRLAVPEKGARGRPKAASA